MPLLVCVVNVKKYANFNTIYLYFKFTEDCFNQHRESSESFNGLVTNRCLSQWWHCYMHHFASVDNEVDDFFHKWYNLKRRYVYPMVYHNYSGTQVSKTLLFQIIGRTKITLLANWTKWCFEIADISNLFINIRLFRSILNRKQFDIYTACYCC